VEHEHETSFEFLCTDHAGIRAGIRRGCVESEQSTKAGSDSIEGCHESDRTEAGVWVIAETSDLPTRYVKIVVTDDAGATLLPELPAANYSVGFADTGWWIRPRQNLRPGKTLNLTAVWRPTTRRGPILSGRALVFDGARAEKMNFGHRPAETAFRLRLKTRRSFSADQVGRLFFLSRYRQSSDA